MKADRDMINKSRVQSCQEFTRLHAGEEKKIFINSSSHTAIPQAQKEWGEQARERLREGE